MLHLVSTTSSEEQYTSTNYHKYNITAIPLIDEDNHPISKNTSKSWLITSHCNSLILITFFISSFFYLKFSNLLFEIFKSSHSDLLFQRRKTSRCQGARYQSSVRTFVTYYYNNDNDEIYFK